MNQHTQSGFTSCKIAKQKRFLVTTCATVLALSLILFYSMNLTPAHTLTAYAAATTGEVYPAPITEFTIPTAGSEPDGITTGSDHNLWFTEYDTDKIGRVTPGGVVTDFSIPKSSGASISPTGITTGPDGNIWFTDRYGNNIGRITPDGGITEFPHSYTSVEPGSIITGPDGNLWFTEYGGAIGRITPQGGITDFPIPSSSINPSGITLGPDGNLWFTAISQVGRITPQGVVTDFSLNNPYAFPGGITAGPDGNLWFAEYNSSRSAIGRITPGGVITDFPIPNVTYPDGTTWFVEPSEITAGPDGNLWFTSNQSLIGRITPAGAITEFVPQNSSSFGSGIAPTGITSGPDGNIWFADYGYNKVGYLALGGTNPTPTPTLTPTPPPPTSARHKLFFFVQGVTSTLDKNGDIPNSTFGQSNGIYQSLNKAFPGSDFRMFSYVSMTSQTYPAYSCPDTFNQHITTYVGYARDQITAYLQQHPNTDVYIVGHSFGGAITFGLLVDMENNGQITTNGGRIAGVVTLDSPLGGVPGGGGIYLQLMERKYKADPDCKSGISNFTSLEDLTAVFNSGNLQYGAQDLILPPVRGILQSNEAYAFIQALHKISVLTIGNQFDFVFDPTKCIGYGTGYIQGEFLSTQWIESLGGDFPVYAREIATGIRSCPDTDHVSINHSLVLTFPGVQTAIVQLVKGQTPSLSNPSIGK